MEFTGKDLNRALVSFVDCQHPGLKLGPSCQVGSELPKKKQQEEEVSVCVTQGALELW